MAFDLTWDFEIADCSGSLDVTSYVFDGAVDLNAEFGQSGRSTAQLTINNNGGEFTPNAQGVYASVDWFSKALVIRASSVATGQNNIVFCGLITDFNIDNPSNKESRVTLVAQDFLTIAGRSDTESSFYSILLPRLNGAELIEKMINPNSFFETYFAPINTPFLSGTLQSEIDLTLGTVEQTTFTNYYLPDARISDWINNQVVPAMPGTLFMDGYTNTASKWTWLGVVLDNFLNRVDAGARNYSIVDTVNASGQIPFKAIDINFNLDGLTNSVQAGLNGEASTTRTNLTSAELYGIRSRRYTQLAGGDPVDVARFWYNRYGTPRYLPQSLTTSYTTLKGSAVDDGVALTAFIDLLTGRTAIWNRITCKYQTTGMTGVATVPLIATGRRIMMTPSDTVIQLKTVYGIDNQSFQLNDPVYGVLGGSPITYDQPIDYDEIGFTYNDTFVEQGARLG